MTTSSVGIPTITYVLIIISIPRVPVVLCVSAYIAVVVLTRSPLAYVPIKVKYRQRRCFCNCSHADFTRGYVVSGREEEDARRTVPRLQLLFLPQGMLIRDGRVRSLLPRSTSLHCRCGPERELKNLNQVSHNSH